MKQIIVFISLFIFTNIGFSQSKNFKNLDVPNRDILKNISELNKIAIAANGGALGCGVIILNLHGKEVLMASSLEFLLSEKHEPNIDLLHAICYARYANQILKDTIWPEPNKSLCFSATEILSVFYTSKSIEYLAVLLDDKMTQFYALKTLNAIGEKDKSFKKPISKIVKNYLLPRDNKINGWTSSVMRQPLIIEIINSNSVKINKKKYKFEELDSFFEKYKNKIGDDYVLVKRNPNQTDEDENKLNLILQNIGLIIVDIEDL